MENNLRGDEKWIHLAYTYHVIQILKSEGCIYMITLYASSLASFILPLISLISLQYWSLFDYEILCIKVENKPWDLTTPTVNDR